jgi:hypothetical protein
LKSISWDSPFKYSYLKLFQEYLAEV